MQDESNWTWKDEVKNISKNLVFAILEMFWSLFPIALILGFFQLLGRLGL